MVVERILGTIFLTLILAVVFIIVTGEASILTVTLAILVSLLFSIAYYRVLVKDYRKLFQPKRYIWMLVFAITYFVVSEVKAHIDVVKRILSPSMPINPGIVRVVAQTESDYSLFLTASAITNTPGTVALYVDRESRELYIHWIDVKARRAEEVREHVSLSFEKFARRIFE